MINIFHKIDILSIMSTSTIADRKIPTPIEGYTTDQGKLIYVFARKYYKTIYNYYDINVYVRKLKNDNYFLLIKDEYWARRFNKAGIQ